MRMRRWGERRRWMRGWGERWRRRRTRGSVRRSRHRALARSARYDPAEGGWLGGAQNSAPTHRVTVAISTPFESGVSVSPRDVASRAAGVRGQRGVGCGRRLKGPSGPHVILRVEVLLVRPWVC
eukprot:2824715-Prymnesium_polylepis.2